MQFATGEDIARPDIEAALAPPVREEQPMVSLAEAEEQHIRRVVRHCKGNLTAAAQILQISRTTLYRKLDDYRTA